jgi:hypothetical protein
MEVIFSLIPEEVIESKIRITSFTGVKKILRNLKIEGLIRIE